tara:strand:+ start:4011 stop:4124 length:114 start_codon:yes stop_codon:yes gene_type:complete
MQAQLALSGSKPSPYREGGYHPDANFGVASYQKEQFS